jgi:hypothetical protein
LLLSQLALRWRVISLRKLLRGEGLQPYSQALQDEALAA